MKTLLKAIIGILVPILRLLESSRSQKINELERRCRQAVESREPGDMEFWKSFDSEIPNCACECVRASSYSPCPIGNDEQLLSYITHEKYVFNGIIQPNLIDRLKNGISCDRINHTDQEACSARFASLLEQGTEKSNNGVAVFLTGSVRDVTHNGNRCFAVYDTALKTNPAHCELVQTSYPLREDLSRAEKKAIRADIRSRFTDILSNDGRAAQIEEIFGA